MPVSYKIGTAVVSKIDSLTRVSLTFAETDDDARVCESIKLSGKLISIAVGQLRYPSPSSSIFIEIRDDVDAIIWSGYAPVGSSEIDETVRLPSTGNSIPLLGEYRILAYTLDKSFTDSTIDIEIVTGEYDAKY